MNRSNLKLSVIADYHARSSFMFPHRYRETIQSPFIMSEEQFMSLQSSVKDIESYFKGQGLSQASSNGLRLSRPDFIYSDGRFRLIDLNVSSSISSFSHSALLTYFAHHPSMVQRRDLVAAGDFDLALSKHLKSKKRFVYFDNPYYPGMKTDTEALRHVVKLRQLGVDITLINPRNFKFVISEGKLKAGNVVFDAVIPGFLSKYSFQEPWLYRLMQRLKHKNLLVCDHFIEFQMMKKSHLANMAKSPKFRDLVNDVHLMCDLHPQDLEEVICERGEWVLKHVDGNNSEDVVLGDALNRSAWARLVKENAGRNDIILQRRISSISRNVPILQENKIRFMDVSPVYSPFVINGRIEGVLVKAYILERKKVNLNRALPAIGYIKKLNKEA